jgi:hypothetical protein
MKTKKFSVKNLPLMPVAIVAGFAALLYFVYMRLNLSRESSGKGPMNPVVYAVVLLVGGFIATVVKPLRFAAAPLFMVGAVLVGFEGVRKVGMAGPAWRLRRGQGRPAGAIGRPAAAVDLARPAGAMGRPAETVDSGTRFSSRARTGSRAY